MYVSRETWQVVNNYTFHVKHKKDIAKLQVRCYNKKTGFYYNDVNIKK